MSASIRNKTESVPTTEISKRPGMLLRLTRQLLKSKTGTMGLVIVVLVILMAILAAVIAPADPTHTVIAKRLLPPMWMNGGSADFLLGTDNLGRSAESELFMAHRYLYLSGFAP